MRKFLSIIVICTLLFAGLIALPRRAGSTFTPSASAQVPTPSLPPLPGGGNDPSPSPKPSDDGSDDDGSDDDGSDDGSSDGGKNGGGSDGKTGGGATKDGGKDGSKDASGSGDEKDRRKGSDGKNGGKDSDKKKKKRGKRGRPPGGNKFVGDYQPSGSFDTTKLVGIATRLRSLGLTEAEVLKEAYAPFIIGGDAAWSNTWGAPRYGPGPIVRTHEGQDVFCHYGDPVLAPEPGKVSYSNGGLGGITARVHTSSSSYWYLTHLSDLNNEVFPAGSSVEVGDVIGFCGNSGNAETTPPHVHFGWYVNEKAKDPHNSLVKWLREAESRVVKTVARKENQRVAQIDRLTAARFFGDWATPDLSELSVSGESLWASGSSPATGAFGLAEAALQAALSKGESALPVRKEDLRSREVDDHLEEAESDTSALTTFLQPGATADAEAGGSD